MKIKDQLISAATDWDRKQAKKKYYNPNGLGIMFQMVDLVCQDIEQGTPKRQAIMKGFNDRLLSHMLKSVGEKDYTAEEMNGIPVVYNA